MYRKHHYVYLFSGGLSDLKPYCQRFNGATLSVTIDRYVYVSVQQSLSQRFELIYGERKEEVASIEDIENPLIRETLRLSGLEATPISLRIDVDLGSESGLGMSGSITVGLLHALHTFAGHEFTVEQLIYEAAHIEIDILEGASGFHDPSVCALGGIQLIEYDGDKIFPKQIILSPVFETLLQSHLRFFYTKRHYKSKPSLSLLIDKMDSALPLLHQIKELAYETERALLNEDLPAFGRCIQKQQTLKQELPGNFCDEDVLRLVSRINQNGGFAQLPGGKIGAYVMAFAPLGVQDKLVHELQELEEVFFRFSTGGTELISVESYLRANPHLSLQSNSIVSNG